MKKHPKLFLKRNYQIIYAIVLILLIPLTITLNTVSSVKSFKKNIDIELQRQALLVGQVFNALIKQDDILAGDLQSQIQSIGQVTQELHSFEVLVPAGENFRITAALQEESIGTLSEDLNNVIAWHQEQAIANLSYSETFGDEQRFWQVVMPLHNQIGEKQALLSLKMSLQVMDDLVKDTLTKSYLILMATVLIVILLLAANTRIFEYALLFKKLKEVDEMKDEFISMASHELRTPITTIKGFLSMILEGDYGKLDDQGQKNLKIMEASVNRLGNLVEDLLNVSRIEQKRLEIKLVKVNTAEVLHSVNDEFALRTEEKNLELKLDLPEDLPSVNADIDKLRQVLINLMGNAVKYTKKGSIELSAKLLDKKFVQISVKDSGIGISAKAREHLFEKFYRVQNKETKGIVGTGLGLWITKQLVELMGGEVFVDSIEHVGTQIYFTIPVYTGELKSKKDA